jgi:hypothetical protein
MPKSTLIAWLFLLAALWAGATMIQRGADRLLANDVLALWLGSTAASLAAVAIAAVGVAISKGRSVTSWATAFFALLVAALMGSAPLVAALLAFLRNPQARIGK